MGNPNRRAAPAFNQPVDHYSPRNHKRRRCNPPRPPPPNCSRPVSQHTLPQRLDAMKNTNWRTRASSKLNPKAPPWKPVAYIMTTNASTTASNNGPTITNIPSFDPAFTFEASAPAPIDTNSHERRMTLRGGRDVRSNENTDLFAGTRIAKEYGRLTAPPLSPPRRAAPPPSCIKSALALQTKLPVTDLLHPSHLTTLTSTAYETEDGEIIEADLSSQPGLKSWAMVDNRLVNKTALDDTTILMREDEDVMQYLDRAKKLHTAAPMGDRYVVRRQTIVGIAPYLRRMRVNTQLATMRYMVEPGWLAETASWKDVVDAVQVVLRQERIEVLRGRVEVLRRENGESVKEYFGYVKTLEKDVLGCEDEVLYDFLVKKSLGGLKDVDIQLRAQVWLRVDGLIDAGGELVRNVAVDDVMDAVFASSRLIGAENEFELLDRIGNEKGALRTGKRVVSGDSGYGSEKKESR